MSGGKGKVFKIASIVGMVRSVAPRPAYAATRDGIPFYFASQ